MEIPKFICPFWGSEQSYSDFVKHVLDAGYDGVEMNVPQGAMGENLVQEIKDNKLVFIAQQWLPQKNESFIEYLENFKHNCLRLAGLNPLQINSHSGKDHFSFEENCQIIETAAEISEKTGVAISHEIHRGRFTFHPYHLQPYLQKYPKLKLTADFSHWCVVCESLLTDQEESMENVIRHVEYIHARVGFEQAPQVNDPRATEWNDTLNRHFEWWDNIINHQKTTGTPLLICPEFGPLPYMPTAPYTKNPLANQWEINLWMKKILTERYIN